MVGKVSQGSHFFGLVDYILREDKGTLLTTNMVEGAPQFLADQMELVADLRDSISAPAKHFILSFSSDDARVLTEESMTTIAEEYLQKMGFDNNQYVVAQHTDTDTLHLHIATNRIKYDGSVVKDNLERFHSRKILLDLERKYSLTKTSEAFKGQSSSYSKSKAIHEGKVYTQSEMKTHIQGHLRGVLSEHPISFEQLEKGLLDKGIKMDLSANKKGLSFSCGDTTYKGSTLGKNYTYSKLYSRLQGNATYQFNGAIRIALKGDCRNVSEFFASLRDQGYEPRLNKAGNGWTLSREGVEIKGYDLQRMSLKKLKDTIENKVLFNDQKIIKGSVFACLKEGVCSKNLFESDLKARGVTVDFNAKPVLFRKGEVSLLEQDIGGRVGQYGISYLLLCNEIDSALSKLVKEGCLRVDLESQLNQFGIGIQSGGNGIIYKKGNLEVKGTDLYKNSDSRLLYGLEQNNIRSKVNEALIQSTSFSDFEKRLGHVGIQVNVSGNKIDYTSSDVKMSEGSAASLPWINKQLLEPPVSRAGGTRMGNMTTKNREDEDESERKRKKGDDYGQTM